MTNTPLFRIQTLLFSSLILTFLFLGNSFAFNADETYSASDEVTPTNTLSDTMWNKMVSVLTKITTKMSILDNGNVGIGTNAPDSALHVKTLTGTNSEIDIQSGDAAKWAMYHDETSEELRLWNVNDLFTFFTNGNLAVTGNISAATPTQNDHLATKEYVDSIVSAGSGTIEVPVGQVGDYYMYDEPGQSVPCRAISIAPDTGLRTNFTKFNQWAPDLGLEKVCYNGSLVSAPILEFKPFNYVSFDVDWEDRLLSNLQSVILPQIYPWVHFSCTLSYNNLPVPSGSTYTGLRNVLPNNSSEVFLDRLRLPTTLTYSHNTSTFQVSSYKSLDSRKIAPSLVTGTSDSNTVDWEVSVFIDNLTCKPV